MKKFAAAVLLCTALFTLTLTYPGGTVPRAEATPAPQSAPAPPKDDPKAKAAYDREWNEIKQKHPRFAAQHLMMRVMLTELVLTERASAFENSGVGLWLRTHCRNKWGVPWLLCQKEKPEQPDPCHKNKLPDPGRPCFDCMGKCGVGDPSGDPLGFGRLDDGGLVRDCVDCLEKAKESGCF
jgi:hypothetical protein